MQCPMTKFDCISCEGKCLLQERRQQADPFRRGNDLRTCDAELVRLGLERCICPPLSEPAIDDCPVRDKSS